MNPRQQNRNDHSYINTRNDDIDNLALTLSMQTQLQSAVSTHSRLNANVDESKPLFRAVDLFQHAPTDLYFANRCRPGRAQTNYEKKEIEKKILKSYPPLLPETWDVELIPNIPEGYPLARTSFEVGLLDGETVAVVTSRVYKLNKERSIQVEYDNKNVIAKCATRSFMKFDIRLFQGTKGNNIRVEIRRRSGCALSFRDEYQNVFQALHNCHSASRQVSPGMKKNLANIEYFNSNFIPLPESSIEESLQLCRNNLSSEVYDTRMLALEELVIITNPSSSEIAPTVCKLILRKYKAILKFALDIIQSVNDNGEDDFLERFRCMALTLLRNIGERSLEDEVFVSMTQSTKSLVHCLVGDIKRARNCPWNACLAAKCLSILIENPNDAILDVCEDAHNALKNAKLIGEKSYASLEKEAIFTDRKSVV